MKLPAIERILLVRLRQIGDVVFTTPAIRGIRELFPEAHLTYLVEPVAAAVVAMNPHLDEVIVASRPSGWLSELRLVRRLRSERFDLAIDFHGGPRASTLTWLSGARMRIGYQVIGRSWMYTQRVGRPRALRRRHSVENQWDLLAPLGVGAALPSTHPVEMPVNVNIDRAVAERLQAAGVGETDCLIVIHVSAGNPFRRWPLESFAALAAGLTRVDARRRILLTAGPAELAAVTTVIARTRAELLDHERARVIECGDFSLTELRSVVERARLYIGGDSGPMHVAATSRVPIVGLYGPTLPERSGPWRAGLAARAVQVEGLSCRPCNQRVCEPGDFRCLTTIQPDEVIKVAERSLAAGDNIS